MKLHAGSLYKNYLVLYGEGQTPRCIVVDDSELQWKIYCNDVELDHESSGSATIEFDGSLYLFPCFLSESPMKDLSFC